jgi:hypothetical protein
MNGLRILLKRWLHIHDFGKWKECIAKRDYSFGHEMVFVTYCRQCSICGYDQYRCERVI